VLSVGALDIVTFGAWSTVPAKFSHRQLYVHNEQVTLMRTNVAENRACAAFIAAKLAAAKAPVAVLLPEKGVSGRGLQSYCLTCGAIDVLTWLLQWE
jgi:uncharacterized protein (UPF0261 family)